MECLPGLPLSDEILQEMVLLAKDTVLANGGIVRTSENPNSSDRVLCPPFTMFPTPFSRELFNTAHELQTDYNLLYHHISHDYKFLEESLKEQIHCDDFIKRLWKIAKSVHENGVVQPVCLGLFRNDYMVDVPEKESELPPTIKQIEFNTIAVSLGAHSRAVSSMHRFLLDYLGFQDDVDKHLLDSNRCIEGYADGLISAWETYGNQKAKIVMVCDNPSRNRFDQRALQYEIYKKNRSIQIFLYTLAEVEKKGVLTGDKCLLIDGHEVAVVYFRTGYTTDDYESEKMWDVRTMLENSRAIKSPCIFCQLSGAKKIQQALCEPGIVEKYLGDGDVTKRIRETFAMQYNFEGPQRDLVLKLALEHPERYVMKPSREGGGNNVYGNDIVDLINEIKDTPELQNYILMKLVKTKPNKNYLVRDGLPVTFEEVVVELGLYSVLLSSGDRVIQNYTCGHLLRTKQSGANEGGMMVGIGAIDSPYLI